MKYLKLFETNMEFNTAKDSFPSGANVSYVIETNGVHVLKIIKEDDLTKGDYIDLGLPSGRKWASCNLGATKPCEYGDYYQWGSISANTNTVCDWTHVPFNDGASSYNATYFNAHKSEWLNGVVLKPEYDAAYQATNGAAHMPTKEDFDELLANTTSEWVNCSYLGGDHTEHTVMGRKFTASNGNSIFIPASGFRYGSTSSNQDSYAYLWGSSLSTSYPLNSWNLRFNSDDIKMYNFDRCYGFCVRGVTDK